MKKYLLTLAALSLVFAAEARKPKNARSRTAAKNSEVIAADSLLAVTSRQASLIDSLRSLVIAEQFAGDAEEPEPAPAPVVSPEQAAADSIAALQLRLRPTKIESIFDSNGLTVIDTLTTDNDAVQVILYSNNSWKYIRNREIAKDSTIFEKYWDTSTLFPYREVDMSGMPKSVVIDLVDSLTSYHCPYQGAVHPRGKYGPRRRRQHQGVDLPLKMGDPIYAAFCGRVRISQYNKGGYGNLVIIRHDNGLETYYGHLSERMVEPGQWVEAGQIIGLGGSTGRSTGPHLHFETRYYGQSFDPERLIDFKNGTLSRETFLLKKSFFSIYSNAGQDFDDEIANEEQDKKEAAEKAAMKYYKIRSGDTLGAIARRNGTTVSNICRLNGIKSTTILQIGRSLRIR
ncbi:peptidoglycan DD-metalloendopeptidase family protein [Alistipes provencensis]|uniref:peptidoglycan DD-metalloendopeptidase family protein n=1 Tax=Alistipes provencensis TaxID=1816676 RepID=UPI000AD885A9|nr:peptidoglycan DD-metalloendopeptidase family protein [Alistipes provencensis]